MWSTHYVFILFYFFAGALYFVFSCFTLVSQLFSLFCDALFCAVGFRPVYVVVFMLFNCIFIARGLQMKNSLLANSGIFNPCIIMCLINLHCPLLK